MNSYITKIVTYLTLISLSSTESCNKDFVKGPCPNYDIVPSSPFNDPIWYPSGQLIGFNHVPIREINYTYGIDCPHQAAYKYADDSAGFWLVHPDGTRLRRVLGRTLQTPAWSPDGKWLAFVDSDQICKMPFDGDEFDTTAIVRLTQEGRNFFPSWSPDGAWIVFDSNVDSPSGLNFIWKMTENGGKKRRIAFAPGDGAARMPFWANDYTIVYQKYTGTGQKIFQMDSSGNDDHPLTSNADLDGYPKVSPDLQKVGYLSQKGTNGLQLYSLKQNTGLTTQLTLDGVIAYSWSPDSQIVFVKYDYSRIDEQNGTLWTMEGDGSNKEQITFNSFIITY